VLTQRAHDLQGVTGAPPQLLALDDGPANAADLREPGSGPGGDLQDAAVLVDQTHAAAGHLDDRERLAFDDLDLDRPGPAASQGRARDPRQVLDAGGRPGGVDTDHGVAEVDPRRPAHLGGVGPGDALDAQAVDVEERRLAGDCSGDDDRDHTHDHGEPL
jgi:hypothetical protein